MAKFSMKSPAKINIFLKVTGTRGSYHEILSRFIRLPNLYDQICFESEICRELTIEGNFSCTRENNSIYRAYVALLKRISEPQKVKTFFKNYKIVVDKHIPECGGLGGGPSNAATFLRMTNDICRLGLSKDELASIGSFIGADVSFFIYDIESANVKGIGEVVEEFNDDLPKLNICTPKINCNTAKVYAHFRQFCYNPDVTSYDVELADMKSSDILLSLPFKEANALCEPTLALYPEMENYLRNEWFMSGSGSTVFCIDKNGTNKCAEI